MKVIGTPVTCEHPWFVNPMTFNRVYEYDDVKKWLIFTMANDDPSGEEFVAYKVADEEAAKVMIARFESLTNIPDMAAYLKSMGEYDYCSF